MILLNILSAISLSVASPAHFNYQGRLFDSLGNPVDSGNKTIVVRVLSQNGECTLYEESHQVQMDGSAGFFSVVLGLGTQNVTTAPPFSLSAVMKNQTTLSHSQMGCTGNSYSAGSTDFRFLRVVIDGEALTPDHVINAAPYALQAASLGAKSLADIETDYQSYANQNLAGSPLPDLGATPLVSGDSFRWNGSQWEVFQAAPADLPSNSVTLDDVNFASNNGINVPQLASDPGTPTAGQMYYNTTSNQMMVYDGTGWVNSSAAGSPWAVLGSDISFSGGNVGVGTVSPLSRLEINGAARNTSSILNLASTIDFSSSNIQYTTSNCGNFSLHNLRDGGAYTFIIQGTSSTTCSFNAFSDAGVTTLTVHLPSGHGATKAGEHTIYSAIVAGTHVYFAWITEFD